jgi:hypothetical protein
MTRRPALPPSAKPPLRQSSINGLAPAIDNSPQALATQSSLIQTGLDAKALTHGVWFFGRICTESSYLSRRCG